MIPYVFPFVDKMKKYIAEGDYQKAFEQLVNNHSIEAEICRYFLLNYIVYSLYATKEVGYEITAADDVMATDFIVNAKSLFTLPFNKQRVLASDVIIKVKTSMSFTITGVRH